MLWQASPRDLRARPVQLGPERAVVAQEALRLLALRVHLGQRVALVAGIVQQLEQFAPRIIVAQVVDVRVTNPRLQHREARLDGAINHISWIRVPAQPHVVVLGGFHDGGGHGRILRGVAVHLHPDLDAVALPVIAQFAQALRYARNRVLDGLAVRDAIGPHLYAPGAGVVRELHPLFADLDLLATPAP